MAYQRLAFVIALAFAACSSAGTDHGGGGGGGSGGSGGVGGDGGSGGGDGGDGTITIVIRDFKLFKANDATTNPDFENVPKTDAKGNPAPGYLGPWPDTNIVTDTIGNDHTPQYKNASGGTLTTHGAAAFAQWYHDVDGVNVRVLYKLPLTKDASGKSGYDSSISGVPYGPGSSVLMFFPIDDGTASATAFGDQGDLHNYCFTAEAHTKFTYHGGETFDYRGDDDVFVYINNKLLINLGGIHNPEPGSIQLDVLGLTPGSSYPLDFFFAERHKGGSNLLFTTTLALEDNPIS
jgi:fibro-slime domain-containing protein